MCEICRQDALRRSAITRRGFLLAASATGLLLERAAAAKGSQGTAKAEKRVVAGRFAEAADGFTCA